MTTQTHITWPTPYAVDIDQETEIGPLRLTIHQDQDAENPWKSWDGMTPLAWFSLGNGRWNGPTVHDSGDSILDALEGVTPQWAARHRAAICSALDLDAVALDAEAAQGAKDWGAGLGFVRLEMLQESLDEMAQGNASDYLDAVAAIWKLRGFNALTFQANGYSQGDSVLGLLVQTPAFLARVGLNNPDKRAADAIAGDLEGDAKLFGAWAFGDVFGFGLSDDQGEHLDSCFGFYGRPEKSWPVLEAALGHLADVAPDQVAQAQGQAEDARQAFLEARLEQKAAQAEGQGGPRLCAILADHLAARVADWRAAKQRAADWRALAALT